MRRVELLIFSSIVGLLSLGAWQGRDWLARSIPLSFANAASSPNPSISPAAPEQTSKDAEKRSPLSHGLTYIARVPGPPDAAVDTANEEAVDLPLFALAAKKRVSPLPAIAQANFTPGI